MHFSLFLCLYESFWKGFESDQRLLTLVEVTLEKVYYGKLKFTIVNGAVSVTGIFQFTMVNSTLVNFHDYRGKNKDDPSPITIWLPKKIGGYISSLSKLCLFC